VVLDCKTNLPISEKVSDQHTHTHIKEITIDLNYESLASKKKSVTDLESFVNSTYMVSCF
jgi:hypothetical protein